MKKSDIVRVIKKRCRHLQRQQEQILAGFNAEANHDFRVEIKKLRALLRLLSYAQAHPKDLHLPKSLQQTYRSVGEIRSFQLQRELVLTVSKERAIPVPTGYMAMLLHNEQNVKSEITEKAKAISISRLCHQLTKALPRNWTNKDAENYMRQKQVQLFAYLSGSSLSEESLHSIRKVLKELLYVWPWIEGVMAAAFPLTLFSKETCLRLAERLGEFQDYCEAISLFNPAYLLGLNSEEQKLVAMIKEECCRRKQNQKEAIIVTLLMLREELQAKLASRQTRSVATSI